MTSNPRSREAAYADLVAGLIDARVDLASDRFDSELETAEASGRLDPATARLLRWWQREAVRAVTEHARSTIPAALTSLERATADARLAVDRADAAWTTARGVAARGGYPTAAEVAPEPFPQAPAAPVAPVAPVPPAPAPAPVPEAQVAYPPAPAAPWQDPYLVPPGVPGTASYAAPAPAYEQAIDEAPAIVDLTATEVSETTETQGEGRRRTLLAGLTVLPRNE